MKILPVDQVRLADAYTISNEPVSSTELMERAGVACADKLFAMVSVGQRITIVAGQGNNGGDGLVIARLLSYLGFDLNLYVVVLKEKGTDDFEINRMRAERAGISIVEIAKADDIPQFSDADVIVDGIFGSGLMRPVNGLPAAVIDAINSSGRKVIAIDLPSGLFADQHTDPAQGAIVEAAVTLTLELPKLALLMPGNFRYCGDWQMVPIGLHPRFIAEASTPYSLFTAEDAMAVFKPRSRVSHKGSFGHGLLMAGSRNKGGAAILAAQGALRSGAGLITCFVPESLTTSLNAAIPEAMVLTDPSPDCLTAMPQLSGFGALAIGPGIGQADVTQRLLYQVINSATCPMVLDADALNILSGQKDWLKMLPPNTIITPHPKEFERLAGASGNDFVRMQKPLTSHRSINAS
jgi:ADP-dependent NAD(P)H-hydrate dehydratase / NAD(P)H-hydrate epimerase